MVSDEWGQWGGNGFMTDLSDEALAFLVFATESEFDSLRKGEHDYSDEFVEQADRISTLLGAEYVARGLVYSQFQADGELKKLRRLAQEHGYALTKE